MNYHKLLGWLEDLWCSLCDLRYQIFSFLGFNMRRRLTEAEEAAQIEEAEKQLIQIGRKYEATKAAKAGEGPQPWDQDWFEYTESLAEDVMEVASKAGWHRLQHFREVLIWALASPQGQRAIASMQDRVGPDPGNPWHEPFVILANLYICVNQSSHKMLREQAKGLNYSEGLTSDLEKSLRKLLAGKGAVVRV